MKLSKIISLLLVPLLLFTLALPAYADGGSESYLIYFETGGGTGVPIIASTNLDGKLLPAQPRHGRLHFRGLVHRRAGRRPHHDQHRVHLGWHHLRPLASHRKRRLFRRVKALAEHAYGGRRFLLPSTRRDISCRRADVFHTCGTLRQIRMVFYDSDPLAHFARRLPPALPC